MKTMNKTQLIGYLGNDPVIKEFETGNLLAHLRLATHHKAKSGSTDETPTYITTWHSVTIWGRERVEKIINQFIKGSHVMVEGKLHYRTYTDKTGHKRYVTEINAHQLINLDR